MFGTDMTLLNLPSLRVLLRALCLAMWDSRGSSQKTFWRRSFSWALLRAVE
jgi:hypothetical protein